MSLIVMKALTDATKLVQLGRVDPSLQHAVMSLKIINNDPNNDCRVGVYITTNQNYTTQLPVDLVLPANIPADNGVAEFDCELVGPGEYIYVVSSLSGCTVRAALLPKA